MDTNIHTIRTIIITHPIVVHDDDEEITRNEIIPLYNSCIQGLSKSDLIEKRDKNGSNEYNGKKRIETISKRSTTTGIYKCLGSIFQYCNI
jgi:hypothetical protein